MRMRSLTFSQLAASSLAVALGTGANVAMAASGCSISALAGDWSFAEQGYTQLCGTSPIPWSELGYFSVDASGNGSGEAVITAVGCGYVGITVPLTAIEVQSLDPGTCIGTGLFSPSGLPPRQVTFTLISNYAFDYISTQGDSTILGHATRRSNGNGQ